jgi:hypothetical protein
MSKNVIDQTLLTLKAAKAWHEKAMREARNIPQGTHIPDEQAEVQDDGSLLIFCDLPDRRVSMSVPPGEWAWVPEN